MISIQKGYSLFNVDKTVGTRNIKHKLANVVQPNDNMDMCLHEFKSFYIGAQKLCKKKRRFMCSAVQIMICYLRLLME